MTAPKQNTRLRGITMTDANALAVAEDRKWQTRRLIADLTFAPTFIQLGVGGKSRYYANERHFLKGAAIDFCPYKPGETLYIRETHFVFGHWEPIGITKTGKTKWKFVEEGWRPPIFEVDRHTIYRKSMDRESPHLPHLYKRLARFMLRKYARTFRTVKAVRAERLQDISESDAILEGVELLDAGKKAPNPEYQGFTTACVEGYKAYLKEHTWQGADRLMVGRYVYAGTCAAPVLSFFSLWQSIHGPGSVELNPWVWVIEFEPTPPHDRD